MTRAAETTPHRADTDIFAQARKALDDDPSIPATVRIHIEEGLAWLTGTVRRASERRDAEEVVRQVPGVQRVVNKITVADRLSEEGFEPPDAGS
jgi:osmotically-inducible protein OsmY